MGAGEFDPDRRRIFQHEPAKNSEVPAKHHQSCPYSPRNFRLVKIHGHGHPINVFFHISPTIGFAIYWNGKLELLVSKTGLPSET